MSEVPNAGDVFNAVDDERMARELVEERKQQAKERYGSASPRQVTLDDLFAQIKQGEIKDFNIIVKADVQGSAEGRQDLAREAHQRGKSASRSSTPASAPSTRATSCSPPPATR